MTLLIVLGALWGLHFSLIKIAASSGMDINGVAALNIGGALIGFTLIAALRRKPPRLSRSSLTFYAACAVLGYTVPVLTELATARHLTAGLLTVIVSTTPFWTTAFSSLLHRRAIGMRTAAGLAFGFGAVVLLVLPDLTGPAGTGSAGWLLLACAVPVSYAVYHIYAERFWPEGADSWQVAHGETGAAALVLLAIMFLGGGTISPAAWMVPEAWTIPVMVLFSILEIYLYFEILRLAGPVFVAQANYVTVVAGVLWAAAIFGDPLTAGMLTCIGLVVLALFLTTGRDGDRSGEGEP
ncbi:DMT family transporter [Leisingera sp. ANG-M1]|uniref:DMT family transporter n=1 Tax=Leisingera sp. ANG-M1 TaxID=1577895 RepID=UPI00187C71A1|nr:DMT family transporter [Leisingera sp. ANG-M1]